MASPFQSTLRGSLNPCETEENGVGHFAWRAVTPKQSVHPWKQVEEIHQGGPPHCSTELCVPMTEMLQLLLE